MNKLNVFTICIITCALLFTNCDENKKKNFLFLLALNSTPVVNLAASVSPIAENGGTSTITASIPEATDKDVTVVFEFTGTPTAPADYTITGSTTIVIPSGSTDGSSDVVITGVDDALYEGDENIVVSITGVTNATAGITPTITLTDEEKGGVSFNTYTEHNYWTTVETIIKDVSMISANGFTLSGGHYVAIFSDGVEFFTVSLPNTVTASSTYDSSDYPEGFSATYTIYVDGFPFDQWIFDGYGHDTNFSLQVTSLSGGRISATFSGVLSMGTLETMFSNSALAAGTLSASISD